MNDFLCDALDQIAKHENMGHIWKNGSHLKKLVTLEKTGHTWKTWVTLGKIGPQCVHVWLTSHTLIKGPLSR